MRSSRWLSLLKLCVSLTLFSRGWLTWKWDSPIRGLIWNEGWWSDRVDWEAFATQSDAAITTGLEMFGIVLLLGAAVPWLSTIPRLRWARWLLLPLTFLLFADSYARFFDSGYQLGMAIEHSLQWGCPLLLFFALRENLVSSRWITVASIASALTFVGHGLYAAGFHPVPLKYLTMTGAILPLEGNGALLFLSVAAYLDFAAAGALFIKPVRKWGLIYMITWGALTALARVLTGPALDPWLIETTVRSSHWMIPLLLLLHPKLREDPAAQ